MIYQPRDEVGGPEGIFNKLTGQPDSQRVVRMTRIVTRIVRMLA